VDAYLGRWITFRHFFVCKVMLVKYSYAFVAMPGRFGTLDEVFKTATLIQTGKIQEFSVVLVGSEFWGPLVEFLRNHLVVAGTIAPSDAERIRVVDSPDEVAAAITVTAMPQFGLSYGPRRWYLGK
jgi:uncharacterized protein (TIGR00730 family)